jgi:hypothetical protein
MAIYVLKKRIYLDHGYYETYENIAFFNASKPPHIVNEAELQKDNHLLEEIAVIECKDDKDWESALNSAIQKYEIEHKAERFYR